VTEDQRSVERVTEVDAETLDAVARLYPQLTDGAIPHPQAISDVLAAGAVLVVARADGWIAGMGTLAITSVLTGTTAHVEDVVVDETARGRGIGEHIMRELIAIARAEGADQMTLTSRPAREAANRLYRRLGFELGETNYYVLELDIRG
jgi:ribosomal protein S18 acetylase RimI-like enzyme